MISIILTTRNTLQYTKLAYKSIRRYNPTIEIVMLDDASSDGTIQWMESLNDDNLIKWYNTEKQLGHTITYNIGAKLATKPIICIFHSDMVCTPNFISNILKHIKPKAIVSGTRIEPPLYPSDDAKILQNFGIYIEEFKQKEFLKFVEEKELEFKNQITKGFFAPWAMYRDEYIEMGGMDPLFRPFPAEDSDFINRLCLAGYNIIQSRDSFCYHWASRSHRWTTGRVNVDTQEFKIHQLKSFKNFLRKWGTSPKNNSFSYPIISKKYDIGIVTNFDDDNIFLKNELDILNIKEELNEWFIIHTLPLIESLSSNLYTDLPQYIVKKYINSEQKNTDFDLNKKIKNINEEQTNDIIVKFKFSDFTGPLDSKKYGIEELSKKSIENMNFLYILSDVLSDSGEIGNMKFNIFNIEIKKLNTYEPHLIHLDDPYYQNQLINPLMNNLHKS
jgi:GT2 family glycosyltransferase